MSAAAFASRWLSAGSLSISTPVSLGTAQGTASSSSVALTTIAAIPAGALVFVGVFAGFGTAQTFTGVGDGTNGANSYTQAQHDAWDVGGSVTTDLWYFPNSAAVSSSATITANFSGASLGGTTVPIICAGYVTGVTASPIDKHVSAKTANTTPYASGSSGTLTQANELAIGFIGEYNNSATITEGSGFTGLNTQTQGTGNFFQGHLAYQIVAATTALNYQPSTSANTYGAALLATFKGY